MYIREETIDHMLIKKTEFATKCPSRILPWANNCSFGLFSLISVLNNSGVNMKMLFLSTPTKQQH